MTTERDAPGVIIFPPILFGTALTLGLLAHWAWPLHFFAPGPARVLGVVLFALSIGLVSWAERVMHGAGTNVRPDQPTLVIVTTGPFRYSRNPLYIASSGILVSIALFFNAVAPIIALVPALLVIRYGVIGREEAYLEKKFGTAYLAYKARVRRWI